MREWKGMLARLNGRTCDSLQLQSAAKVMSETVHCEVGFDEDGFAYILGDEVARCRRQPCEVSSRNWEAFDSLGW